MNTAAAISRAAMPDTHTICGVKLRPWSIGHWLHLNAAEVSFVCGGNHTLNDLLLAVIVCSKSYEDFAGSLHQDAIKRELELLARRLSGGFMGVWKRRFKRWRGKVVHPEEILGFDFQSACKAFEFYIADHGGSKTVVNRWSRPVTAAKTEQKTREIGCPEEMLLLNALTTEQGFSQSEALNMPLPQARWERAIFCERKDWVRIVDDSALEELRSEKARADEFARKVMAGEVKS